MSKSANKKAIGAFVVIAIALAVAAIIVLGSGKFLVQRDRYVSYFQGSVKGLRVGAPVVFRGAQVGEVTDVTIYANRQDHSARIAVLYEILPGNFRSEGPAPKDNEKNMQELIQSGLRAQLEMQSIVTGQLMINIDFHPDKPLRLVGTKEIKLPEDVIEIPTIETTMQKIEQILEDTSLNEIVSSVSKSLKSIEGIMTSEELTKSLHYLKQTLKEVRDLTRHLDEKIDPLTADLTQTLKDTQELLSSVNGHVDPLAVSFKRTSDTATATLNDARGLVKDVDGQINDLAGGIKDVIGHAGKTLQSADETLVVVSATLQDGSPLRFEVSNALEELARAAQSLRILANYIERHPDALLRGRADTGGR